VILDNRTKRSVAIDLRTGDGQDLLHRLVRDVDVFRHPTRRSTRARGCVFATRTCPAQRAPGLCVDQRLRRDGRGASKPGFDSIALWARTGLMDLVRASPDVPPARSLPGMGDHPTGTALFAAIMAGLYHRERTGAAPWWPRRSWPTALDETPSPCKASSAGRARGTPAPRGSHQRAGQPLPLPGRAMVHADDHGRRASLGSFARGSARGPPSRSALCGDARTGARTPALTHPSTRWFGTKDWRRGRRSSRRPGIAFGVVATLGDVRHDVQMRASGALVPIDDPRAGASITVSSPLRSAGKRGSPNTRAGIGSTRSRCCAPPALPRRRSTTPACGVIVQA